ncbi:hypothetical protein GZH47_32150 (plasmid) [Paenibacillus rhizovicinus]|uniref:Uncharacterized protein n=1 Tax=Paenibacillus rhizovicinus TaxID=2704463 RepID=A0A6C0PAB8_9BACL|nr:hypothetical protein [Paenibacillus rhizovicinus]QHW35540.1 hypothetical protein GZH47_32150 [Paenibacillus rhizovicinus]
MKLLAFKKDVHLRFGVKSNRIRSGENIDPAEYEDLKPDWITFKEYLMEAQHRITIDGQLSDEHKLILLQHNRKILIDQLTAFAMKMGCPANAALDYAERVEVQNREAGNDVEFLYLEMAKLGVRPLMSEIRMRNQSLRKERSIKKYKSLIKRILGSLFLMAA